LKHPVFEKIQMTGTKTNPSLFLYLSKVKYIEVAPWLVQGMNRFKFFNINTNWPPFALIAISVFNLVLKLKKKNRDLNGGKSGFPKSLYKKSNFTRGYPRYYIRPIECAKPP
jgi:hypothetical protein